MDDTKRLIILAGSPRGGVKTWETMFVEIVKKYKNVDIAVCTSNQFLNSFEFKKKPNYIWSFNEYEDWDDYYLENNKINSLNFLKQGVDTGLYTSGKIHFAIKDIILKNYIAIIESYDYILYTRFDQYFIGDPILKNELNIQIPIGEDYFGVCDRSAYFDSSYARKFLNILDYLEQDIYISSEYINCETVFLEQLKHFNLIDKISRTDRFQFTTAKKEDKTNWRIAKYRLYGFSNLYLKYPDEFIMSCSNYINNYGWFNFFVNKFLLSINYIYLLSRIKFGKLKSTHTTH